MVHTTKSFRQISKTHSYYMFPHKITKKQNGICKKKDILTVKKVLFQKRKKIYA